MVSGIRAEVEVSDANCPIARVSAETETPTYGISKAARPTDGRVTEEFTLDAPTPVENDRMEEVFSYGTRRVYRFSRDEHRGCLCEHVEREGSPVVDLHAQDGKLSLAFHAPDLESLERILKRLNDRFDVHIHRLVHAEGEAGQDIVFVDRSRLTARQLEVMTTAHEMGYFERPKGANAGRVAEALGITTATFSEHLAAAQTKLLDAILDD